MGFQPDLLVVRPAVSLRVAIYLLHLGACVAVLLSAAPVYIAVPFVVCLVLSAWRADACYGRLVSPNAIRKLCPRPGRETLSVDLLLAGGEWVTALPKDAFIRRWVILLELVDSRSRRYLLVVVPESVGDEAFRRLQVWFRFRDWHADWRAQFSSGQR